MVIREIKSHAANILKSAGIEEYIFETDCILCDILGMNKTGLIISADKTVPDNTAEKIISAAEKRASGYPLQYILGKWEFYGLEFKVGEGVLIPRPDTEILVETVIEKLGNINSPKMIDLCGGSGCIAISLKKNLPDAVVYTAELSDKALPYLTENARLNDADINIIEGDVTSPDLAEKFGGIKFDCIVSNPPYLTDDEMNELMPEVACEPETALRGGKDGLFFYRKISEIWKDRLADGGLLAFEIGYRQGKAVTEIMRNAGFCDISVKKDLGGNDRVVTGSRRRQTVHPQKNI